MYLVQDIETIPETELQSYNQELTDKAKENGDMNPFPPIWAHKVVCIGMLALDSNLHPIKGGCAAGGLTTNASEYDQIARWSQITENNNSPLALVDWNGKAFDMPVLQTRAFALGIQLPWYFQAKDPKNKWSKPYRDRYGGQHIDLADDWTNRNAFKKPSLLHLATLMGLPGKVGIDGSKVYGAYLQGKYREIDTYCMQDVIQTAFIFQRYHYLQGKLNLEQYQRATTSLLNWVDQQPEQQDFRATIDDDKLQLRS